MEQEEWDAEAVTEATGWSAEPKQDGNGGKTGEKSDTWSEWDRPCPNPSE